MLFHVRYNYAVARPSVVCNVRVPTQPVEIFRKFSTPFNTLDIRRKFYGDRPRGIPPSGELNARVVAKYSDFGPIEGPISETVQDRT